MIAYKVLRRGQTGNGLFSSVVLFNLMQRYVPEVKATAKVGGFLCFRKVHTARVFMGKLRACTDGGLRFEIWKVEVEQEITLPENRIYSINDCLPSSLMKLWEYKYVLNPMDYDSWPEGTMAYKHVTLKEKVE